MDEEKGKRGKEFDGLSSRVIAAAIEVHRALGPGFLESIYENALCAESDAVGIAYERQMAVPVRYRGQLVGEHRLDLLAEKELIIELKAIRAVEAVHFAVVRSYLRALDLRVALLLNFASAPLTIRRVDLE